MTTLLLHIFPHRHFSTMIFMLLVGFSDIFCQIIISSIFYSVTREPENLKLKVKLCLRRGLFKPLDAKKIEG